MNQGSGVRFISRKAYGTTATRNCVISMQHEVLGWLHAQCSQHQQIQSAQGCHQCYNAVKCRYQLQSCPPDTGLPRRGPGLLAMMMMSLWTRRWPRKRRRPGLHRKGRGRRLKLLKRKKERSCRGVHKARDASVCCSCLPHLVSRRSTALRSKSTLGLLQLIAGCRKPGNCCPVCNET